MVAATNWCPDNLYQQTDVNGGFDQFEFGLARRLGVTVIEQTVVSSEISEWV